MWQKYIYALLIAWCFLISNILHKRKFLKYFITPGLEKNEKNNKFYHEGEI